MSNVRQSENGNASSENTSIDDSSAKQNQGKPGVSNSTSSPSTTSASPASRSGSVAKVGSGSTIAKKRRGQSKARERERERDFKRREKELRRLHERLNTATGENISYSGLIEFYLVALELPNELRRVLTALSYIDFYLCPDSEIVEDLLLHGRTSSTHRKLKGALKRIARGGAFSWGSDDDVTSYLLENVNFGGSREQPLPVEEVMDKVASEDTGDMYFGYIFRKLEDLLLGRSYPRKLVEVASQLQLLIDDVPHAWGEHPRAQMLNSPLLTLIPELEFINGSALVEFLRCAHEYNLEWALASYDWSRGRDATLISGLQRAVDESPWGRKS